MQRSGNFWEDYTRGILKRIDVHHPHQLHIENLYTRLGLELYYIPHGSMLVDGMVFLDNRKTDAEQWEDFAHELAHRLFHEGDQLQMPVFMRQHQEKQAELFALHFCVPTFMLEASGIEEARHPVHHVMETFGVTKSFAERRLEQYGRAFAYR